jgi:hypothetical protein
MRLWSRRRGRLRRPPPPLAYTLRAPLAAWGGRGAGNSSLGGAARGVPVGAGGARGRVWSGGRVLGCKGD